MKMSQRYDGEQKQLKKDIEELQRQCDKDDDRRLLQRTVFESGAEVISPSGCKAELFASKLDSCRNEMCSAIFAIMNG